MMTLAKAHDRRLCVTVIRSGEGPNDLTGVILALSPEWCLLASVEALEFDGYWVIRRDLILSVQFRRFERFRHEIAVRKGLLDDLPVPDGLDITDSGLLFTSLVDRRRFTIVYRERDAKWWSLHAAVVGTEGGHLRLHGFDGAGRFEPRIRKYRISEVTCLRVEGRYLTEYQIAAPYDFELGKPAEVPPKSER